MTGSAVAEFDQVSKVFVHGLTGRAGIRALDDVSFDVMPGEVFGLVGPNRAGKTTLVKMLLGLCRPTRGRTLRFGQPPANRGTLARVGYVHENQAFPRYWDAFGLLEYYGALALVPEEELRDRIPRLLELVSLADRSREPIGRFSKGMIQRLGLAQALVNDPDLLVLDEPTEGLDLEGRQFVREVVVERKWRGRAALLVTHALHEVEALCDRIAVIVKGRLVHCGAVAVLRQNPNGVGLRPLAESLQSLYASLAL